MVYNVYGPKQVDDATRRYNAVATTAPVYRDSTETVQARTQANNAANAYINTVNKGYHSQYGDQISMLASRYQNNKFDYDAQKSPEYQVYKDYYTREGSKAQENVQGSYTANTGGYGNSYAQAAGQRAFGSYMEELANKIPTLRNTALQNWNQQQEQTLNQIGLLKGFDDTAYGRYRDQVEDNYNFMNYYQNKYTTSKGLDMTAFSQELQNWQSRLSAAQSDLANIRSLAESQYEHQTLSADTQATLRQQAAQNQANLNLQYQQLNQQAAQTKAYYDYLNSRVRG